MSARLLLIEEPPVLSCAEEVGRVLIAQGFHTRTVAWDGNPALVERADACAAILAFSSPASTITPPLADWIQQRETAVPVVVIFPDCQEPEAVVLFSADDFIVPPIRPEELLARIRRTLRSRAQIEDVKNQLANEFIENQLIGSAATFLTTLARARLIAAEDSPALITGETGTGKELFARAIHHLSRRRAHPFIPVDCAALPDHLFENEMFGHERGAYTDARATQPGLAALAEGGTLFLDELDSLSLANQVKLLRFVENKTYRPLGSSTYRTADVNIIAATNRDLKACVRARDFREDLYFRLNVLDIHLPPLRERASDIESLARHFLKRLRPEKTFSPKALAALSAYHWPGNVRELHNTVRRAAVLAAGRQIVPGDLGMSDPPGREPAGLGFREARAQAIEHFEKAYLDDLLGSVGGNITQAARRAGKDRRAMGRLVQKYHLKPKTT